MRCGKRTMLEKLNKKPFIGQFREVDPCVWADQFITSNEFISALCLNLDRSHGST